MDLPLFLLLEQTKIVSLTTLFVIIISAIAFSVSVCLLVCLFLRVNWYSDAQADVMISSIDVYVLTVSTFLSMIVAVVVAVKALDHLISPSCPQPLFQSGVKRKAINIKKYIYIFYLYANLTDDFN